MARVLTTDALAAALHHIPAAIMITDAFGRVLFANASALQLATQGDGLCLHAGMIEADSAHQTTLLQRAVQTTVTNRSSSTMLLTRRASAPLQVLVVPLTAVDQSTGANEAAVGVFVTDPDTPAAVVTARLSTLFQLTPAEARFSARLAAGKSLKEAASEQAITNHTARGLVKQLLRKTNTCTQAQAVIKLLMSVAGLR